MSRYRRDIECTPKYILERELKINKVNLDIMLAETKILQAENELIMIEIERKIEMENKKLEEQKKYDNYNKEDILNDDCYDGDDDEI